MFTNHPYNSGVFGVFRIVIEYSLQNCVSEDNTKTPMRLQGIKYDGMYIVYMNSTDRIL